MTYSPEQIAAHKATICQQIAGGKSLREICEAEGMPSRETVRVWLAEDGTFSGQYAQAREEQADFYADEIVSIADEAKDANLARVRIDARKWKASKLDPKRYGDKLDLNHSGSVSMLSEEQLESRVAQLLGKAGIGVAPGGDGTTEGET